MVVMKFGGTSVADAQPIRRVASLVAAQPGSRVVVTSALAGVADRLRQVAGLAGAGRGDAARDVLRRVVERHRALAAALCGSVNPSTNELLDTLQRDLDALLADRHDGPALAPASIDAIAGAGPLMASRIVADALGSLQQIDTAWIDARGLIETNGEPGTAAVTLSGTADRIEQQLRPLLATGRVPVVAGGVGASDTGTTTTLGDDGADLTAAALGVELDALEVQLWTDVEGVRAADPRVLRRTQPVPHLSYGEARDLAGFGARVLHPGAIELAATCRVPLRVRSSRRPDADGTTISANGTEPRREPAGFACRRSLVTAIFTPHAGTAHALLEAALGIAQRVTPKPVLALTVDDRLLAACDDGTAVSSLAAGLSSTASVRTYADTALLAGVADGLCDRPGATEDMTSALDGIVVHATARTATASALLAVIDDADVEAAMTRLHDRHYPAAGAPGAAGPATLAEAAS
jgi:aspartate kinase